ncbi:hypothetical protein ZIOFF_021971 [Zingiber officinale]|uniref:Uncharacterized protein n=1 Tax=Zingiber officinale TaxID=94328 RepID=A0A8J5HKR1_ZINOF|nr:hypothetical protein ZIOFF_021971 [Zingiber officinale]
MFFFFVSFPKPYSSPTPPHRPLRRLPPHHPLHRLLSRLPPHHSAITASDLHLLPVFTLDDRVDFIPEADLLPPSQLSPISARSWGQKGSLSPSPSYSSSSCFLPTRATEMNGAGPFDRCGKNPEGLSWMISPADKSGE